LSVVVTTRNDDHGGDPLKRLQSLVNTLDAHCRRTGLDAELIVVEWNPPAGKPRVADLLRMPDPPACTYRFVDVPPAIHQRLQHADVLPLFQMIAKNVGIRRARGQYVLATNIDIIFSCELMDFLAARALEPNRLYRLDRRDIQPQFPIDAPLADQMDYCRTHQLRVHRRWATYATDSSGTPVGAADDIADGRSIVLGRGWHMREQAEIRAVRWASDEVEITVDADAVGIRGNAVLELDVESNPYVSGSDIALAIIEGATTLREVTIAGRAVVDVGLGPSQGPRRIRLRAVAACDQRTMAPLFDLRSGLYYRVHGIRLRAAIDDRPEMFEYPADAWVHADVSPHIVAERIRGGVAVTTDAVAHSYCVQMGECRSDRQARYRFILRYTVLEGGLEFNALSGDRSRWLQTDAKRSRIDGTDQIELDVTADGNEGFWLVVANRHPDGYGVSRGVIHDLRGSEDPSVLNVHRPAPDESAAAGRRTVDLRSAISRARIRRRLSLWTDRIVESLSSRLSPRIRFRIVRGAPEYRDLETAYKLHAARVHELTPLQSLANLHRFLLNSRPDNLHVNACGDFQLMSRDNWHALRGYPEFETFSMNIDGLFTYIADAAGVREACIDASIYHFEHEVGSGWSPEGEAALRRRIAERGITWLEVPTVFIWAAYMKWLRRPFLFNAASWGFGDEALPERVVAAAVERVSR
jgi:hypothetical protein